MTIQITEDEQQVLTVLADFLPDSKPLVALLAYRSDQVAEPVLRLHTRASLARTLGALQRKAMTSKRTERGTAVYRIMPHGLRVVAARCTGKGQPVPAAVAHALGQQPAVSMSERTEWAGRSFTEPGEITVPARLIKLDEGERVTTIYDLPGTDPILAIGITTAGNLLYGVRAGQGWAFEPQWIGRCGESAAALQGTLEQVGAEQHVLDRQRYPSALRQAMRDVLASRPGRWGTLAEIEAARPSIPRHHMIHELAWMRDDGEVEFNGPRYKLLDRQAGS